MREQGVILRKIMYSQASIYPAKQRQPDSD